MKLLANFSRIFTGLVFVFSGFVKGVDPLGTAYRIEDYFIAGNLQAFIPLALILSIVLCAAEFALGAMLLLNLRMKLTAWLVLLMMSFFTVLTFFDAIYNPVPDCGCFGDALKLTNWQTFYKNIVLIVLAFIIFASRKKFKSLFTNRIQWGGSVLAFAGFIGFCLYNIVFLPVVDFSEWKVGNKLYVDNPQPMKYFLTYKNKKSGEQKEFLSPNYPYDDTVWMAQWEFVSQRVDDPNVYFGKKLVISDTLGQKYNDQILRNPGLQLVVNVYDHKKVNAAKMAEIEKLCRDLEKDMVQSAILISATKEDVAAFAKKHNIQTPIYQADDIELKIMVRSNPGLMLINKGVVAAKWSCSELPDYEDFKKNFISVKK